MLTPLRKMYILVPIPIKMSKNNCQFCLTNADLALLDIKIKVGRISAHDISLWSWHKQWMQIIILKTTTGLPPIPLSHNIINNNNQLAHRGGVEPPHVTTTLLKVNVDFVSK